MATAKIPVRVKGHTTCGHHKGKQLDFYCEKCKEPVCPKCVTSLHKGHLFCDLGEITPQKKKKIRNLIDETEQNVLQDIGNYIESTNTLLTENDRTFEKLSKDLKAQTEKMKQDLDKLTAETLSIYQDMKDDNIKLIHKYKQDLELYDKQLKHKMQDCKKVLQQGSPLEIYDIKCENDPLIHLPVKPMFGTVSFTPNKHPRYYLELALGTCQFVNSGQTPALSINDLSFSSSHGQPSTQQTSGGTMKKEVTRTKLLTEPRVVEEWESQCDIACICPTNDGQAWTCSKNSKQLKLMDDEGIVMEVQHMTLINDISLSPVTHRLWACDRDKSILELVSGKVSVRFRTNDEPECICVTSDNPYHYRLV
ncbi:E3 ubiquitin-protein ligase TRIM71-like [Argopecten irradians]|uniref:E3 ubiquitin-protein ligase TRIM71-like n=1 Tax=Argopecten irradians TaxID=31199 RepID=UPI003711E83F